MTKKEQEAIEVFKKGGVVIFPTDTAIGIGCRMDDKNAVRRLFEIRKRPENKPLLVLVDSLKMAEEYLFPIPEEVKNNLIKSHWPGKLTIILKCNPDKVHLPVRDRRGTLGIRFPNDLKLLKLIREVGVPIVAPSANFSGKETPFEFKNLDQELVRQADFVLNEKTALDTNVSTIIDCTVTPWEIIRQGAVKIKSVVLLIDTADNKKNIVGLKINGKKYFLTKDVSSNRTQVILPMINEILKKHKLTLSGLSAIEINIGPGSYTGLRVGLSIANTLSFSLKIPINGRKLGEIILPKYK
jgi:L-threonylcarbamoyladenylate synthase